VRYLGGHSSVIPRSERASQRQRVLSHRTSVNSTVLWYRELSALWLYYCCLYFTAEPAHRQHGKEVDVVCCDSDGGDKRKEPLGSHRGFGIVYIEEQLAVLCSGSSTHPWTVPG